SDAGDAGSSAQNLPLLRPGRREGAVDWPPAVSKAMYFYRRVRPYRWNNDMNNIKPLEGVKILDLTRVLAGPFATMNLGDLGAEVIKVERPGVGDDTRTWGPPFVGTESTYYLSVNRNKKSIAVNIKDPKGVKIIRELAAVCDVFVENYVPGKLSAMGLGYEDIDKIAPHIIYCSIT
ncbi:SUGCT isoform 5, partial [Pongo abelii]